MPQFSLAARLKELRTAKHYTQDYVSSKLHITRSSYSNYENGTRTPSTESLIRLAQFYHISINDLLNIPEYRETSLQLSVEERFLIYTYRSLTSENQREMLSFAEFKRAVSVSSQAADSRPHAKADKIPKTMAQKSAFPSRPSDCRLL